MKLFDTHAHLADPAFDADRDALIASLASSGVELVTEVGCDTRDLSPALSLANRYDFIYAALGMHPHDSKDMDQRQMDELRRCLALPKVVALGEIGLDYHYDLSPREDQRRWFAEQLDLAKELDMPVVLHIREAFGDCMDILRAHRDGLKGVMHCFSGSPEFAKECLDLGLYIAFGGSLTFKNARRIIEAAAIVPLDRLVIETDSPYLAPVPHRGERNTPRNVALVAEKLAEVRSMDVETLAGTTFANGLRLFNIPYCGMSHAEL